MAYQYGCLYGICWSEHFGFSIQVAFLEVWNVTWGYHFLLNYTKILFLSFWASLKLILTFNKWGGVAWDYLHSQSTILLLFTEYLYPQSTTFINICFTMIPHSLLLLCNFYQHLLYHDTLFIDTSSFIASSMNELIKWAYPGQPMP